MSKVFEYKFQILEHHLDTFGHVNNAVYLELYEEARWDIIHHGGHGLADIMKQKQGPVILECQVKFKRELTNREYITIKSHVSKNKGKIFVIEQQMINEDGKICSEAAFTCGYMDLVERKLIIPPDSWANALGMDS